MPAILRQTSMATGTQATPIQGDQYEILPFPAYVEIAIVSDNTGVTATIFAGTDVLSTSGPVQQKATPPTPIYPDDYIWTDHVLAGDRLGIFLNNANAGTVLVGTRVRITPVG
jgi:hypothetical protein